MRAGGSGRDTVSAGRSRIGNGPSFSTWEPAPVVTERSRCGGRDYERELDHAEAVTAFSNGESMYDPDLEVVNPSDF